MMHERIYTDVFGSVVSPGSVMAFKSDDPEFPAMVAAQGLEVHLLCQGAKHVFRIPPLTNIRWGDDSPELASFVGELIDDLNLRVYHAMVLLSNNSLAALWPDTNPLYPAFDSHDTATHGQARTFGFVMLGAPTNVLYVTPNVPRHDRREAFARSNPSPKHLQAQVFGHSEYCPPSFIKIIGHAANVDAIQTLVRHHASHLASDETSPDYDTDIADQVEAELKTNPDFSNWYAHGDFPDYRVSVDIVRLNSKYDTQVVHRLRGQFCETILAHDIRMCISALFEIEGGRVGESDLAKWDAAIDVFTDENIYEARFWSAKGNGGACHRAAFKTYQLLQQMASGNTGVPWWHEREVVA